MKKTILILLLAVTTSAISQEVRNIEINDKKENFNTDDSISINENNININSKNVFYVNGELMKNLIDIKRINPKAIKVFDIKKGVFTVDRITYEKKISIKTYEKYKDNFLLTEEEYSQIKKPIKIVARKL